MAKENSTGFNWIIWLCKLIYNLFIKSRKSSYKKPNACDYLEYHLRSVPCKFGCPSVDIKQEIEMHA